MIKNLSLTQAADVEKIKCAASHIVEMATSPYGTPQPIDLDSSASQLNEDADRMGHARDAFSLKAADHLIAVVESCKQGKFDRQQLRYMFEYVKTFSWALTEEVQELVKTGASAKVEDDSYFRALEKNLKTAKTGLGSRPRH